MQENNIRRLFKVSVLLKAANAIAEIVGGTSLLFTGEITKVVSQMIQREFLEDPRDLVANVVQHYLPYFSEHSQLFAAYYLLSHGIIKIFLAVGLLRNKLWAYPAAIVFFVLFILYQVYRYTYAPSSLLIFLTIFDLIVVALTWHEYKIVRRLRMPRGTDRREPTAGVR